MTKENEKPLNLKENTQSNLGFVKPESKSLIVKPNVKIGESEFDLTGLPPRITKSKHFNQYFEWLRANWGTPECEKQAKEQFKEDISYSTFYNAKKIMNERGYIIPNYKASLLNGIESPYIDPIQEMRNILTLRFKHIAELFEKQQTMQDKVGAVPYILKAVQEEKDATSRDLAVLFQMEMKNKEFNFQRDVKMGVIDGSEIIEVSAQSIPSEHDIKQIVSAFTKEQADAMKMALHWAQRVYLLDLPEIIELIIIEEIAEVILAFNMVVESRIEIKEYAETAKDLLWFTPSQEIRVMEWMTAKTI